MTELLDISHWQEVTNWQKMVDAGIKGVYIKFSQGTGYKDPEAGRHYVRAKSAGLWVGAYHFVTNDNGIKQYDWFMNCIGDRAFDMPPMLDCEAYTSHDMYKYTFFNNYEYENEVFPVRELNYGRINENEFLKMSDILGYSYPTEAIVDVIGMRLQGFQGFAFPTIYTNYSSGNVIFKSETMARYPLHVANWGVQTPLLPKVWQKKGTYYLWQDNVVPGEQYGVVGRVDHNVTGVEFYVKDPTTPPPVSEMLVTAYPTGKKFQGMIKEVT
jgi:GH25 family lysozyme M1 (1,4-beta-N-acetylmuramidase)